MAMCTFVIKKYALTLINIIISMNFKQYLKEKHGLETEFISLKLLELIEEYANFIHVTNNTGVLQEPVLYRKECTFCSTYFNLIDSITPIMCKQCREQMPY